MKWYKHISDSLDDPFIFELMDEFGADGYLVFFGTLEIYSREFKPELNWKLNVTQSYLTQKLHKRQSTLVIKILKHIQNSGKWELELNDNQVIIFIPKFTELIDEWSKRKLGSCSVVAPKILKTDKEEEVEVEEEVDKDIPPIAPQGAINVKIPYQEIIEYLNLKTGKHFEHTSKETKAKIKARWGINGKQRTIQDFKTVIDNKVTQWLDDEKMAAFLRPETLFGIKFEGYLNEIIHPLSGKVSDKTIATVKMLENWRPPNAK